MRQSSFALVLQRNTWRADLDSTRAAESVTNNHRERTLRYRKYTDAELIGWCLAKDQLAWDELIGRHGGLVYSIPRRHGLSQADAEDVFQNVFMIVLRRLADLRNQMCLPAWLITITVRETQRFCKRIVVNEMLDEGLADEGEAPLESYQRWEQVALVKAALQRLEPRDRELLTRLLQDPSPSYDQLAKDFGLAVGSIGATRARCFKKLEAVLLEMGVSGGPKHGSF